jgi:hypothetical protein
MVHRMDEIERRRRVWVWGLLHRMNENWCTKDMMLVIYMKIGLLRICLG